MRLLQFCWLLIFIFYLNWENAWASYLGFFFIGLAAIWLVIQFYALTMYPRLLEPSFKEAQKNGLAMLGAYPILTLLITILAALLLFLGVIIPLVGLALSFSFTALLLNNTTDQIIKDVRKRQDDWKEEKDEWGLDDESLENDKNG